MNALKTILPIFLAITLLGSFAFAQSADGGFSLEKNTVSLSRGQSVGIALTITNQSGAQSCYTVSGILGYEQKRNVEISGSQGQICLNAGESTTATITVTALGNAYFGNYVAGIQLAGTGTGTFTKNLMVNVLDFGNSYYGQGSGGYDGQIGLQRLSPYLICRDDRFSAKIRLLVSNNGPTPANLSISGQHELLLPEFKYPDLALNSWASQEVEMEINFNSTTAPGEYRIPVRASLNGTLVQREIAISLQDCQKNFFDLTVNPGSISLQRNGSAGFYATIANRTADTQTINVSADSDIPLLLDATSVTLGPYQSRQVYMVATARDDQNDGAHEIAVYAWNMDENEQRTVTAYVAGEHKITLWAQNNDFDARICSPGSGQSFEVTVYNSGTYTENVSLYIDNPDRAIGTKLSVQNFTLAKGQSKKAVVAALAGNDAQKGRHTINLRAYASGYPQSSQSIGLRFTVADANPGAMPGALEIASYPKSIELPAGSEKGVPIVVANNGTLPLENVKVRITGLGDGVSFGTLGIGNIAPGKSSTALGKISAGENARAGTYFAKLEISADGGYFESRDATVKVSKAQAAAGQGQSNSGAKTPIGGFIVLGGKNPVLAGGAVILIFLAAIILVMTLLDSGNNAMRRAGRAGNL